MGRNPTLVNGDPVRAVAALSDGDRIEIPGRAFHVVSGAAAEPESTWLIELSGERIYRVSSSPFHVGGGDDDDLTVPRWPRRALRFHLAQGALFVEGSGAITLDDDPLSAEEVARVRHGAVLALDGETLRVIAAGVTGASTTALDPAEARPSRAELQFLPRGGRLTLEFDSGVYAAWLSELRADLVATLLQPPGNHRPGDYIDDELIISRVWPRQPEKDRRDLNLLVYWVRKALLNAGLNGVNLLQRAPGGGATRFLLDPKASVLVMD